VSVETEPIVIAKALVVDPEGQALVLERSLTDTHRPGGVDLPGGSANYDENGVLENPIATATREIFEEAGIKFSPDDLTEVAVLTHERESDGRRFRRHLFVGYVATLGSELDVKLDPKEHKSHWWAAQERLEDELEGTHWATGIRLAREKGLLARPEAA
jgi:8-oxo-dGTP pyrophosphatase MutT (NUDIX family)